jgi:hypothetical protein
MFVTKVCVAETGTRSDGTIHSSKPYNFLWSSCLVLNLRETFALLLYIYIFFTELNFLLLHFGNRNLTRQIVIC